MKLTALQSRLTSLFGFDLGSTESTDLINEAKNRLASDSKFPRKPWTFDTVAGDGTYSFPSDLIAPIAVRVNGVKYRPSDAATASEFEKGYMVLYDAGVWFTDKDENTLNFWPVPSEVVSVDVQYVYRPIDLVDGDNEPTAFPEEFHPDLLHYVAAVYYRTVEDNPDLAQVNMDEFNKRVGDLRAFRIDRETGGGSARIGIDGITA